MYKVIFGRLGSAADTLDHAHHDSQLIFLMQNRSPAEECMQAAGFFCGLTSMSRVTD